MIGIIDYGMGNLRSVQKAFEFLGEETLVSSDIEKLQACDGVILPGVGSFKAAMENIKQKKLDIFIKEYINKGKPFLGICLGLQVMFEWSEEGDVEGLGILKGKIKKFPIKPGLKIPHMGWNQLLFKEDDDLFKGVAKSSYVYFVHSYYLDAPENISIANCVHGIEFCAAARDKNVFAVQFHPEKSGDVGLIMLKNFIDCIKGEKR